MGLFERLRPQPGWKDPDPQVRRAAVRRLADPTLLTDLCKTDPDGPVREAAAAALLSLALEGTDEAAGATAVSLIEDAKLIAQIARSGLHESVSRAALLRLHDLKALGSIARHGRHAVVRLDALDRLVDQSAAAALIREELCAIALKSPHDDAALSALEHLTGSERFALPGVTGGGPSSPGPDADFLNEVAGHGKSRAVVRRARVLLHERQESATGRDLHPRSDRRRQLRLCEEAESFARSTDCEPLAERLSAAHDSWTDLVPGVDDDLDERFQTAIETARERLKHNLAAREERLLHDENARVYRERHVAPRLALIAAVEATQGDDTPRLLDDACWEWNRLEAPDSTRPADAIEAEVLAEARALGGRFDEARKACQCRYETLVRDREQVRLQEEKEAARRDSEQKQQETAREKGGNLERLQKLCERAERLLKSESLSLKKADPILREVRTALDDMPLVPSRRDHERILERLKAARAGLAPRAQELREGEKWKRWANTNVQEELCARAEALLLIEDPEAAARRLPDLMERWKTASEAEPDRSQALWQRFKVAADQVRARQESLHTGNAEKKVALCDRAEALAGSTDWTGSAEAIKALQAEWKTIGQAGRGQEKALWERFRGTCDRFFTRRDEDRTRRKEEWARNLEAREALCVRAEALAVSTDWKTTAAEIKKLQIDWKGIGPVRPNRSEAIWQRFRAACDRFFERYKKREQIDRELVEAARVAICRDLESLLEDPDGAAAAAAAPSDLPPAGGIVTGIESAWTRWQKSPPLPREQAAPLVERFNKALDSLLAAHPDAVKGTPFDTVENRRRMEELCTRLERLVAGQGAAADQSLSPATRLATMWREAMASNTIGGKVAEETRQRAASEEVRKAQAAWQKIGYVPEDERRALADRFERACRRLMPKAERDTPAPARTPAVGGRRSRA
jgi:uncharacterized protein DUF349